MMRVQTLMVTAVLVGICVMLAGCPAGGDKNIQLIVSSSTVDFGTSSQPITLKITKNDTSRAMGPAIVAPVESWITVEACLDIAAGCVSSGPSDEIQVPIRVDHSLMALGQNVGSVVIHSNGAPTEVVTVRATAAMVPDFAVDERMPPVGRSIRFSDRTQSQLTNEPIIGYKWDFGDGTPVTETTNSFIDHVYATTGSYTVKFTVTTAQRSETVTRSSCVVVGGQTPVADFSMSSDNIYEGQEIRFTDLSTGTANPIVSWRWVFKRTADGTSQTSTVQNPRHTFSQSGWYTVSLTVALSTAPDAETATKTTQVLVRKYETPVANFSRGEGYVDTPTTFTDTSSPGSSPITSWLWNFGDGSTSTAQNPTHTYTAAGTYTVSLTVTTARGSSQCSREVPVSRYTLQARFEADKVRIITGDTVTFTDMSIHGPETITAYDWDFGDGTTGTGAVVTHVYNAVGSYTVKLKISTAYDSNTVQKVGYINCLYQATALDNYVRTPLPDPNFSYELRNSIDYGNCVVYIFKLTAQVWRTAPTVDKPTWEHWLTIICPTNVTTSRALLIVSGGSNTSSMPTGVASAFRSIAIGSGSVVAEIKGIPSEPLKFADDPLGLVSRNEDEIIAYSFWQYLQTADDTWPLLLPMVKSTVRAMDVIQDFLPTSSTPTTVDDFVVTGASKRGWTTWLTAATDFRVAAIAPMVIDILNATEQMDHQREVYGAYGSAVQDYTDMNIMWYWRNTNDGRNLLEIVDPYSYRDRLTMPKLIFSGTGDQFFLPDSSQFYIDQLLGENELCIIPNVDHGLSNPNDPNSQEYEDVIPPLVAWYVSLLPGQTASPTLSWNASDTTITVTSDTTPTYALMWKATSPDRDFRLESGTASAWTYTMLNSVGVNQYRAAPTQDPTLWTGFYIQMYFANPNLGNSYPYVYSTELRVMPPSTDVVPTPNFMAKAPVLPIGDPVPHQLLFSDLTKPGTATITSRYWEFGDGAYSYSRDPSHTYGAAGAYSVKLKIGYRFGTSATTTTETTISVTAP